MKKFIVVLGGGESGVGAAVLAAKQGFPVLLSDNGNIAEKHKEVLLHHEIDFEENGHSRDKIPEANEVIKSPGIPDYAEIVQEIRGYGIPIISEIEFAARFTDAYKVCATGSNGKTTTALIINHILKNAGMNVAVAGNMGRSFAYVIANENPDYVVLEISSFQLDGMFDFKADIAVLTSLTPDHLDRYNNSFKEYINSKFRILQNQSANDHLVFNADDKVIAEEVQNRETSAQLHPFSLKSEKMKEGAFINEKNEIEINIKNSIVTMTIEELALQGKHNTYNSMAGDIAARLLEIRKETIKQCLSDFQNVEHRLEYVARVHGVEFINDSKATNVNSTWYALESTSAPIIWVVGGIDKGNDYDMLKELVKEKVKIMVCLGVDNRKLIDTFSEDVEQMFTTTDAEQAVNTAYYMSQPGYTVLLSPACASFDLFENYEDRGRQFKNAVTNL